MTAEALRELIETTDLRASLLDMAASLPPSRQAAFYSTAWCTVSRLRPGRSVEWYLARVLFTYEHQRPRRPFVIGPPPWERALQARGGKKQ